MKETTHTNLIRYRNHFIKEEKLKEEESETIEYKHYIPPFNENAIFIIQKTINAFLNTRGGRIYIGINDYKVVKGIYLSESEKDKTGNYLINLTKDFYPQCRRDKIKVFFIPVKNENNDFIIPNLYVIKLIIHQGDIKHLYSTMYFSFTSYYRVNSQNIILKSNEISDLIYNRRIGHSLVIQEPLENFDDSPKLINESDERKKKNRNSKRKIIKDVIDLVDEDRLPSVYRSELSLKEIEDPWEMKSKTVKKTTFNHDQSCIISID